MSEIRDPSTDLGQLRKSERPDSRPARCNRTVLSIFRKDVSHNKIGSSGVTHDVTATVTNYAYWS
jgi:hypothetical protein